MIFMSINNRAIHRENETNKKSVTTPFVIFLIVLLIAWRMNTFDQDCKIVM